MLFRSALRPEDTGDPLFPEGAAAAVELARQDPSALPARVPPGQADAFAAALAAHAALVETSQAQGPPPRPEPPRVLSVSQVLTYDRCPQAFYWTVVRPLPAPPHPAARLGAVVHRLLERRARSLPDLVDVGDLGGDGPGASTPEPGLVERATRNFAATRYAHLPAPEAEVGVALRSGPWVVRGRIDAVFRDGAEVELVDWKTGRPEAAGPGRLDQLGLYALALLELGELSGGCTASYCDLGGPAPEVHTRRYGPADLEEQRGLLALVLGRIDRGEYDHGCGRPGCPACGPFGPTPRPRP